MSTCASSRPTSKYTMVHVPSTRVQILYQPRVRDYPIALASRVYYFDPETGWKDSIQIDDATQGFVPASVNAVDLSQYPQPDSYDLDELFETALRATKWKRPKTARLSYTHDRTCPSSLRPPTGRDPYLFASAPHLEDFFHMDHEGAYTEKCKASFEVQRDNCAAYLTVKYTVGGLNAAEIPLDCDLAALARRNASETQRAWAWGFCDRATRLASRIASGMEWSSAH